MNREVCQLNVYGTVLHHRIDLYLCSYPLCTSTKSQTLRSGRAFFSLSCHRSNIKRTTRCSSYNTYNYTLRATAQAKPQARKVSTNNTQQNNTQDAENMPKPKLQLMNFPPQAFCSAHAIPGKIQELTLTCCEDQIASGSRTWSL